MMNDDNFTGENFQETEADFGSQTSILRTVYCKFTLRTSCRMRQ